MELWLISLLPFIHIQCQGEVRAGCSLRDRELRPWWLRLRLRLRLIWARGRVRPGVGSQAQLRAQTARWWWGRGGRAETGLGCQPVGGVRIRPSDGNHGPPVERPGRAVGTGSVWGQARTWACGWARLGRAHGRAGPGCGELETGPGVASPGQGCWTWGLKWGPGSWAGWG